MAQPNNNGNEDAVAPSLGLTPSADDILDVATPLNYFSAHASEEENNYQITHRPSQPPNEEAFSSSSGEDDDNDEGDDDDNEEDDDDDDDDKFHGHSEDDDGSEYSDDYSGSGSRSGSGEGYNPSEWDKALKTGRPSKGHASDFFAAPSHSGDSSEFLSMADQDVLREASIAGDASGGPTSTTSASNKSTASIRAKPQGSQAPPLPRSNSNTTASATATGPIRQNHSFASHTTGLTMNSFGNSTTRPSVNTNGSTVTSSSGPTMRPHPADNEDLSAGVLPDVLMNMRQKLESLSLFDTDMMRLAANQEDDDPMVQESRESLKRSSQQSISAAVLVSLAHKRYERRRLGAMEIEKVVRSLVQQYELDRIRAILLLLSDDYVRSNSEDARKGGVVALAACAIGLKKANDQDATVQECRDLILASVVHACQDHSQRVRYYATESLFNVVKVIPSLAVQHFFILFEILRSLYADVDPDVRSGAELLDKKLKEVIVIAMNSGSFTADACVPVFARFVYMRNKATKRLTLTWLQELNEKLIGGK
jgi:vacuole morphology and inheritance protein 14